MYAAVMAIHVIACLILITSILLQSGRGGGLAGLLGQATSSTIFGTRASTFLTRATTVAAIVFLLTCISLTIFSSRRAKSLIDDVQESEEMKQPATEENPKVSEEKPQMPEQEAR